MVGFFHNESWRQTQITDARAKLIFYSAFVEGKLEAPKSLLPEVHRLYFEPQGHGQAGGVSGDSLLPVVLSFGALPASPPP